MATDTTTIEDQLRALVRLQIIDTKIDQLTKLRGDLPDEIRDLEDERAGLQTRLGKIDQDKKEAEVQKKKLKLDIAESEGLIRKYEEQQLQVRNNREYDALTKEIEAHRQRIGAAYEEIERYDNLDTDSAETVDGADDTLKELESRIADKRVELDRVVEETKAEQQTYEKQRDKAAKEIDERYRRAYERLRTRVRDGRAVVPIERGAAAGFMVPPQRQVEVRQRDRIIVSEHDGRIIVDDALFSEVTGE
ncbi:zinc ribbon domain-containing protein [Rubrivirga sp. IMCC43871]|uniref:zinc ribbon domain-containing protein n=1 Tax=Rubrivirga sp. IMCC43871 TaxID=3391575 RepID=UPI00398FF19A